MPVSYEMFFLEEMLTKRTRELERFRFTELASIAPMTAMEGCKDPDHVNLSMPETIEGGEVRIGDDFVGRDRYLWVQKTVALPSHLDGCEVYGLFNFGRTGGGHNSGFESLLYVDGHPYQAVDTNHSDVNFESLAGKTVTLTFMLWTGLEGGGPKREMRHRIQQADIGYLHGETDELYYLGKAIFKTVKLLEDDAPVRHDLIAALNRAYQKIDWDEDRFYDTVGAALASLKADLAGMEKHSDVTVNVVGHTHIDVAWLWRLKHTREKAMRSFSTVLRLMEEFDEYVFLQTQPQLYQYIKSDCPEIYEMIRQRVAEGRWEADGGMWLEADCNISSGEALTRHFLYGMRLIEQEFGHKCEYLWLPDVFGYSWALPQILKGVGIESFVTSKISWNKFNTMPNDLFKWRGIDGSEVMTYFLTVPELGDDFNNRYATYNGMISPRTLIGTWKKFRNKDICREVLIPYGYGDGGGGVNRNMLKMRRAMENLPGVPNVRPDRAGNFLRRVHEAVDKTDRYVSTWDGELYLEFHRGTYTSQGYNKKMNRFMEFALAECEWLSEMAHLAGGVYDQDALVTGWQTILRNQFHDIIPGSSIGEVYADCRREYGQTADALRTVAKNAFSTLAKEEKDAWTVWHFGSFARRAQVFIPETRDGVFTDDAGNLLPAQKAGNGWWVSVEIPALTLRTVRFAEKVCEAAVSPFCADLENRSIRTPFYLAQWDENGHLTRLYDEENKAEVIPAGEKANVLRVYEDRPLEYDNWELDPFYVLKSDDAVLSKTPELIECGAVRAVIRFEYTYRHSSFVQDVIFYADSRRIDFETRADWHEDSRILKAVFPVDIRATKATYDIQYGHVERPNHFNTSWDYARFEVVGHKWADLSEDNYGVSLMNNCKYGYSIHNNVMQITLLKAGKYPDTEADIGQHAFTYALLPHSGSVTAGNTIEEAVALNLPARVLSGASASVPAAFSTDCRNVAFDAVKKSEDGDSLIVRFHECRGGKAEAELIPGFKAVSFTPCNLREEPIGETIAASTLHTRLRPFEIQTWKVEVEA